MRYLNVIFCFYLIRLVYTFENLVQFILFKFYSIFHKKNYNFLNLKIQVEEYLT